MRNKLGFGHIHRNYKDDDVIGLLRYSNSWRSQQSPSTNVTDGDSLQRLVNVQQMQNESVPNFKRRWLSLLDVGRSGVSLHHRMSPKEIPKTRHATNYWHVCF
jgi:hypothetical protein